MFSLECSHRFDIRRGTVSQSIQWNISEKHIPLVSGLIHESRRDTCRLKGKKLYIKFVSKGSLLNVDISAIGKH